jgi:hypothetical protein
MLEELNVVYGNTKDFWDKSEEDRFKYFKNATINYLAVLKLLEKNEDFKSEAATMVITFANVMFFLIYLMTTDKEQQNQIEIKWLSRMKEEVDNPIFANMKDVGEA